MGRHPGGTAQTGQRNGNFRDRGSFKERYWMSRLFLILAFLVGAVMAAPIAASAQDVDVAAASESVLAADPEALATALEAPPDDSLLPDGFVNPPSGEAENADIIEQFTGAIGNIDGSVATINHGFDTDPEVVPGLISAGILTYIVTEEEITAEDLDEFEDGASEGLDSGTPEATGEDATPVAFAPEGGVERIDFGGAEAVVITVSVEQAGVSVAVQIVAVPVGTTMAIGTVLVADQGGVDQEQVRGFAEAIATAGVEHLGTVAEGA